MWWCWIIIGSYNLHDTETCYKNMRRIPFVTVIVALMLSHLTFSHFLPSIIPHLLSLHHFFRGKTNYINLGSFLIKPVQRVMRYPLLLMELLGATPESHHDRPQLTQALQAVKEINVNINEYKRRKDLGKKNPLKLHSSCLRLQLLSSKQRERFSLCCPQWWSTGKVTKTHSSRRSQSWACTPLSKNPTESAATSNTSREFHHRYKLLPAKISGLVVAESSKTCLFLSLFVFWLSVRLKMKLLMKLRRSSGCRRDSSSLLSGTFPCTFNT